MTHETQRLINEWRKKGWSIPDLRGGKHSWFPMVQGLVDQLYEENGCELDAFPEVDGIPNVRQWREYSGFLRGVGLAENKGGLLRLSDLGIAFQKRPTEIALGNLIQDRYRFFGELLNLFASKPMTIEEAKDALCGQYGLDWKNLSRVRKRADWLEVLGLIEPHGSHAWIASESGIRALGEWNLMPPDVLGLMNAEPLSSDAEIQDPPEEIAALVSRLADAPELHEQRSSYNIWVPSPNRIDNLRVITQFASERITRDDLFDLIGSEFGIKKSSIESMMPFLKVAGLIEEVGRGVYLATPAAMAWVETGNDLDFIRVLHVHMRFVGEMIVAAREDTIRNDLYEIAKEHGINIDKARWIAGFLLEAGLLEEPSYLHLKATATGLKLAEQLPLYDPHKVEADIVLPVRDEEEPECDVSNSVLSVERLIDKLARSSVDPMAEGKQSGVAFEENIAELFCFMGFDAKRIGGSGNTDVVVRWEDRSGQVITAIIDAKSKSSGNVSHTDVSDVAISTHKEKNNAEYVAIVGPNFSGDTIKSHARKMSFALVNVAELGDIARSFAAVGLSREEIACVFKAPGGQSELSDIITEKQRKLEIIAAVVAEFRKSQGELGGLSPRDLLLLLRGHSVSPSLDELVMAFDSLSDDTVGVLVPMSRGGAPEHTAYVLRDAKAAARHLRALADAIDSGLEA